MKMKYYKIMNTLNRTINFSLYVPSAAKIFAGIFVSLFSFQAHAQLLEGLDESFLEGLPPSLRESIEVKNADQSEADLEQLFRTDSSVEKNKIILKKLYDQLDALDLRFDALEENDTDDLIRFGDSFFSSIQSSFMPINIPNMASEYVVDVGDKFKIMLTGSAKSTSDEFIQRDGTIMIPGVGKVFIAGLTLSDAIEAIEEYSAEKAIGTMPFVTLSEVRDMQILVMGGIESPGIYTLSGGSSILSAINVAGGISSEGSFRKIEHRRNGKVINSVDLYDILIFGKNPFLGNLRSGDTVYIHPSFFLVPVTGGVSFNALFEMLPNETVQSAISFAGDFSEGFAGFSSVTLKRTNLDTQRVIDLSIADLPKFILQPRDAILVPSYVNYRETMRMVNLQGMVERPGEYFIGENETLESLINRAGGYKSNAYVFGAALFRQDALEKEKAFAQLNYSDTVNYIVSNIGKPNSSINSSAIDLLAEELRSRQLSGRVITDFDFDGIELNDSIILQDKDQIVIPAMQKVVYMFGDFKQPSNIEYSSSSSIESYIAIAGGLKDSAYKELIIIDPDGKTHLYTKSRFRSSGNIDIYPGSIVYAPRDIGRLSGLLYASTVSPIVSSLALSIAALNSINK